MRGQRQNLILCTKMSSFRLDQTYCQVLGPAIGYSDPNESLAGVLSITHANLASKRMEWVDESLAGLSILQKTLEKHAPKVREGIGNKNMATLESLLEDVPLVKPEKLLLGYLLESREGYKIMAAVLSSVISDDNGSSLSYRGVFVYGKQLVAITEAPFQSAEYKEQRKVIEDKKMLDELTSKVVARWPQIIDYKIKAPDSKGFIIPAQGIFSLE